MKTLKFLAIAIISVAMLQACKSPEGEKTETKDAEQVKTAEGVSYAVDTQASSVKWLGTKPTGEHYGYVPIAEGELMVKDDMITGGNFTMTVANLTVEDIEDEETNAKLSGHLRSPDFFNTDTFPTISFEITGVEQLQDEVTDEGMQLTHKISGNLTIKDITKNISFKAQVNMAEGKIEAMTPQFLIDRTKWNVNYGSKKVFDNLKDNFIHDDIGITIKLHAKK